MVASHRLERVLLRDKLAARRVERGLTMDDVSRAMGRSRAFVGQILIPNEGRLPTMKTLRLLEKALEEAVPTSRFPVARGAPHRYTNETAGIAGKVAAETGRAHRWDSRTAREDGLRGAAARRRKLREGEGLPTLAALPDTFQNGAWTDS